MYSKSISAALAAKGISEGDMVSVRTDGFSIEGRLMPKPEVGDADTLIIKLGNGYNVGVSYSKSVELGKVGEKEPLPEAKRPKVEARKDLPGVTLLWTGGTIGSRVDYRTSGVSMTTKPEDLLAVIPELAGIANITIKHLFNIASEDMSYHEWQEIAEAAADALNSGARGVVVTHGTDTMHYTAAALSFMLQDLNAPVVLTGSQRSSDRGSSDAFTNLIAAVRLAAEADMAEVGICMHAGSSDYEMQLIRGTKARKMHTSRRDAFRAINDTPMAKVSVDGGISYTGAFRRIGKAGKKVGTKTGFEPKVAIVKAFPGADPAILEFYAKKGYKGVIVEGTGLGHAPVSTQHAELSWKGPLEKAVKDGMVIGMAAQCIYGRVHKYVYKNLRLISNAGVLFCSDMTSETAMVKLGWLLGNYKREEAAGMLEKNLVGEINDRIEYEEFPE